MPIRQVNTGQDGDPSQAPETVSDRAKKIGISILGVLVSGIVIYIGAAGTGLLDHFFPSAGDVVPKLLGEPPLKVISVERVVARNGKYLVVPGPVTASDSEFVSSMDVMRTTPEGRRKFDEWSAARGIHDGGTSFWEVVIEGRMEKAVTVTRMTPVLDGGICSPPLKGGTLIDDTKSGEIEKIPFRLDLDRRPLELMTWDAKGKEYVPYFDEKGITLTKDETQAFTIQAISRKWACAWRLQVSYLFDGEPGSMVISAPGDNPFRTTALHPLNSYDGFYPGPLVLCDPPRSLMGKQEMKRHYRKEENVIACGD